LFEVFMRRLRTQDDNPSCNNTVQPHFMSAKLMHYTTKHKQIETMQNGDNDQHNTIDLFSVRAF